MKTLLRRLFGTTPKTRKPVTRSTRRFQPAFEMLENREMLSASPLLPSAGLTSSAAVDPSHILVRFRSDSSADQSSDLPGTQLGQSLDLVSGLREVDLSPSVSVADALAAYEADSRVLYAEPDYLFQALSIPNDPGFGSEWGLNNTGQNGGKVNADINAPEAWNITTGNHIHNGKGTIVAVIDTGIDYRHPDLAPNMWHSSTGSVGYDFINNDADPMDDFYHGTHVAGIIGAASNNGMGVAGVDWHVQLMAVKVLDASGHGSVDAEIKGINYAVNNGAEVLNLSWGGYVDVPAVRDALTNARQHGVIVVAAAGNDSLNDDSKPLYPAAYNLDNMISVAATDQKDGLASFSNYGAHTVAMGAPGSYILSTFPTTMTAAMTRLKTDWTGQPVHTYYATIGGTSMATPMVTGVVALVKDLRPNWSYQQIIDQVESSGDLLPSLQGKTITGRRLDAFNAVSISPIADKYAALGGPKGPLGMPNGPEGVLVDGAHFRHFANGFSIYWTPQTGAHEVHGLIRNLWASMGWEKSLLHYPTTDESTTPDGIGRYNHFQGGSIYWTPNTGAHEVYGAIRQLWSNMGWERSWLGYPTSGEYSWNGGRRSDFQGGYIFWTNASGAKAFHTGRVGPVVVGGHLSMGGVITLEFDRSINPASVTRQQISIIAPNGAQLRDQITGISVSGSTLTITFNRQTTPGTYRVVIGPDITDSSGNGMYKDGVADPYVAVIQWNPGR